MKKTASINLFIFLFYTILIQLLLNNSQDKKLPIIIYTGFCIFIHFLILFISGINSYHNNSNDGKSKILISLVLLMIGFSTCLGTSTIF